MLQLHSPTSAGGIISCKVWWRQGERLGTERRLDNGTGYLDADSPLPWEVLVAALLSRAGQCSKEPRASRSDFSAEKKGNAAIR